MCLPIDSCFGFGAPRTDDDRYHAPAASRPQQHGQRINGGHYNGYPAHRAAAVAAADADRKAASNDARRDHAHVVPAGAPRAWHGHGPATGAPQEKMAAAYPPYAGTDGGTLKQPQPAAAAANGRVAAAADGQGARGGGGTQHNYYYHYEPAHREDAADSYYPPAATATTADHER